MRISKEQVRQVAEVARLLITEDEAETLSEQLSETLEFVEKLHELDTEHVEPTSRVVSIQNVLRKDEVRPSSPRDQVLANAAQTEDGLFKVPAIFEE